MQPVFEFDSVPALVSGRIVLRRIEPEEDLPALFELFTDTAVAQHTDTGPFTSIDDAREVMEWIDSIFVHRRGIRWAIALRSDAKAMIGTCGYNEWRRWNHSAEIGYDLMRRFWGAGVMTEALRSMIRFGFERMRLNRIEADVTVGNDASARVLEKLGFREEGLLRQRGYWKGEYHDLRFFGLLRGEWLA